MILPQYLTKASGPSGSVESSSSTTYDYSGLDDRAKKIDAVQQLRPAKYQALYNGDVAGSASIEQRIRDLLDSINNPKVPLVRVASESSRSSSSSSGAEVAGYHHHALAAKEEDDEDGAGAQARKITGRRDPLAAAWPDNSLQQRYVSTIG